MSNPLRRLKFLPWTILFQDAALTVLIATLLDILIGSLNTPLVRQAYTLLFSPPLGILMLIAVSMAVGALAVYLLEKIFRQVVINAAVLWALIPCLVIMIILKSWLPIPFVLVDANQSSLLGIVLGVFLKGWNYWRR
jgi:hypothetical protein